MNLHKLCLNNIANYLKKGKWLKSLGTESDHNLMNSFVGRRLLHRHLRYSANETTLGSDFQSALNDHYLPDSVKKAFFSALETGSKHIPQGTIMIEGDMSLLKTCDWLNVELNILKQALAAPGTANVNAATFLSESYRDYESPYVIRNFTPKWFNIAERVSVALATVIAGVAVHSWLPDEVYGITIVSGGICHLILAIWSTDHANDRNHGDAARQASQAISKTWDDVFEMKTDMDAVLLGVLFEIHNEAKKHQPGCALPNFLAMPPYYAYLIAMQVLSSRGEVLRSGVDSLLSITNELLDKHPVERNEHSVDGIDLSALVYKDTCVQNVPEPHAMHDQLVHQNQPIAH